MLEMADLKETMTKDAYRELSKIQKEQLVALQQTIKQYKIPVIILFEGWGTAGKGSLISKMILNLDPRGFKVYSPPTHPKRKLRYPVFGGTGSGCPLGAIWPSLTGAGTRK